MSIRTCVVVRDVVEGCIQALTWKPLIIFTNILASSDVSAGQTFESDKQEVCKLQMNGGGDLLQVELRTIHKSIAPLFICTCVRH